MLTTIIRLVLGICQEPMGELLFASLRRAAIFYRRWETYTKALCQIHAQLSQYAGLIAYYSPDIASPSPVAQSQRVAQIHIHKLYNGIDA